MNNYIFYILIAVCLVTHAARTIYEIGKFKKKIKPNKLNFIAMLINMFAMWASWFSLCEADIIKINIPGMLRYIGMAVFIAGLLLFFIALLTIKTLENYKGDLITNGIYSRISHPMYLSFILWMIGYSIYHQALFSFLFSFILTANVLYWKRLEEKELVNKYENYKSYRGKTFF